MYDTLITVVTLGTNDSIAGHVLWEITSACDDTKPRGIRVICIISCDRGRPTYICTASDEIGRWPAWKGACFVHTY